MFKIKEDITLRKFKLFSAFLCGARKESFNKQTLQMEKKFYIRKCYFLIPFPFNGKDYLLQIPLFAFKKFRL